MLATIVRVAQSRILEKIGDRWKDLEIIFPILQTKCFYLILFRRKRRKSKNITLKKKSPKKSGHMRLSPEVIQIDVIEAQGGHIKYNDLILVLNITK